MRFLQPIGILHNNNADPNKRHSTYATTTTTTGIATNGNNHQIVTIIQPHRNLSGGQNETTTSTYNNFDDDHPNVTIRNNSVTFTKNYFNQNNRQKYNVVSNQHYVNEVDNLIRETNQTTGNTGFNGNAFSPFIGNITYHMQQDNINEEHSQIINNANQTYNNHHHHNAITNNIVCRENLTKLDLDTNIQHHVITRVGDCGSSICSESSPDDSFMDDEDVRSVSSSFCPSLASPEPEVKYPRGIINPNYPGFQHLAHTLAEHFVDHHFEQSDSEVSEFEVELKASSDVDNGNNIISNNDDINGDLDKIEEILRGVFKSKETSPSEELNVHRRNDFNEMSGKCDVISLTDDIPMKQEPNVLIASDAKRLHSTPDILIKSNSFEKHIDLTEICEKPDILKNVFASDSIDGSDQVMMGNDKCENYEHLEKCEQSQWSITPIDIVGNFEQEVEREFGLIVSGYRSSSSDDEMCVSVQNRADEVGQNKDNAMYDKMTDAVLSNAKETINTTIGDCAHDQLKLSTENCSVKDVADAVHPLDKSSAERQRIVTKSSTHSIPTAIVKPKYQRTSYDDRQLPPVVGIDREKPWYDNCSTVNGNATLTTPNKKIQQLPHFERKHKKHRGAGGHRTHSGSVSEKEKFNSILIGEKDMDSASVAVVPPRKKDKIEQVDVYGNGDKGIKCSTIIKSLARKLRNPARFHVSTISTDRCLSKYFEKRFNSSSDSKSMMIYFSLRHCSRYKNQPSVLRMHIRKKKPSMNLTSEIYVCLICVRE